MTNPRARLVVSAALFIGWLGFLFYLVVNSRGVILSKPQFLMAQLIVVADIGALQADMPEPIVIDEVLWSNDAADEKWLNKKKIEIAGIAQVVRKDGYEGPGKYLLPLMKTAAGTFQVTPLPSVGQKPEIRIYPWAPDLRRQVDAIIGSRSQKHQ